MRIFSFFSLLFSSGSKAFKFIVIYLLHVTNIILGQTLFGLHAKEGKRQNYTFIYIIPHKDQSDLLGVWTLLSLLLQETQYSYRKKQEDGDIVNSSHKIKFYLSD